MRIPLVLTALAVSFLAACSGTQTRLAPDEYHQQASAAFKDKNYDVAITRYKELLDQYPFDEHAEEAELHIAQSYYKTKKYPEAIAAFNDFQRMHPMSPHLPEVYYLLGKSYMDQMSTIDRDQAAAESAQGWFRVVTERYPESPYSAKARRKRVQCREALAGHELYVASFYFKQRNLKAAENRVKVILESYPETQAATRALEKLADARARAGDTAGAEAARAAADERRAAFAALPAQGPGSIREGGVPDVTTPATDALLANLDERYGPGTSLAGGPAVPTLIDPAPAAARGAPRGPGSGTEPLP